MIDRTAAEVNASVTYLAPGEKLSDKDALADRLDAGLLAGAALDVFKTEPLPADSRLWKTKNLLITPHVAGNLTLPYTVDTNVAMFCENLRAYAQGRPLKHVVDRTKGY